MSIVISFSVADLTKALSKKELAAIEAGGLDGDEVWYRYRTQMDDRVRPSHASLEGTLWRCDDPNAPTPPTAYGCRCYIEYCAAPDSVASKILPEADGELANRNASFALWLNANQDGWKSIAKEAATLRPVDRLEFIREELIDAGTSGSLARDIAFMILSLV